MSVQKYIQVWLSLAKKTLQRRCVEIPHFKRLCTPTTCTQFQAWTTRKWYSNRMRYFHTSSSHLREWFTCMKFTFYSIRLGKWKKVDMARCRLWHAYEYYCINHKPKCMDNWIIVATDIYLFLVWHCSGTHKPESTRCPQLYQTACK